MKNNPTDPACDNPHDSPFQAHAAEHQMASKQTEHKATSSTTKSSKSQGPTHTAAGTRLEDSYTTRPNSNKAKYLVLVTLVVLVLACYKVAQHMFAAYHSAVQFQEQVSQLYQQEQQPDPKQPDAGQLDATQAKPNLEQAIDAYAENYAQQVEQGFLDKFLHLENLTQLTVLSDLQYLTNLTLLAEYYSDYSLNELHRKLFLLERLHRQLPEMREVTKRLYQEMGQNYNWLTKFASTIVGQAINVESKEAFPYLIDQLDCLTNLTDRQLVEDAVRQAMEQGTFFVGDTHQQWILQDRSQPRAIQFDLADQKFYGIFYPAYQSASAHYDIALDHDKDALYPPEFRDYLTHKLTKNEVSLEFRLTCRQHEPKPAKS